MYRKCPIRPALSRSIDHSECPASQAQPVITASRSGLLWPFGSIMHGRLLASLTACLTPSPHLPAGCRLGRFWGQHLPFLLDSWIRYRSVCDRVHLFVFFLQIPAITGNGIPDEILLKTAFSERKVNSNLKNGILEISGGIPDFQVENVIFLLQMLQTYEELNNLIEYFLYLLYIAMYNAY